MQCPHCQSPLKKATYKGVHVYECEKKHGMWFVKDDLRLAKDSMSEELRWLDFDLFSEIEGKFQSAHGDRHCPICQAPMQALQYAHSKVVIDVCLHRHGVWLDKQEFQKIIHYLDTLLNKKTSSDYAKDVVKEFEEIATGSESKISEVKDFLAVSRLYEMRLIAEHPWMESVLATYYAVTPFR
ncbi:MAG: zf-TFIIB domain-containing protein [Candidatus Levybacteria bacterium]|nr:zf-TFIIB domain-containing protein [Candidatus Levybacteria bacterium]